MNVLVDPEFSALIPPPSAGERTALESSLVAEGCRDALVTWRATLLMVAGEHPRVVQERLGHSSIKLTIDT